MDGTSSASKKKREVAPVQYECPLDILPRDIWVKIATKVASHSIRDLFNMQATCKVFLDAGTSDAVYQHATMWQIRLVSFLFYLDRPERKFLDRCVEGGNADALLRQGMAEYFWIGRRGIGMEMLARAASEGSVESCYLFAMLLLCEHEDEAEVQSDVETVEFICATGKIERCREFFADMFWERWIDERPSDPGQTIACRSMACKTRSIMAGMNDVSRVSCVQCLADNEVRVFLSMFTFQ